MQVLTNLILHDMGFPVSSKVKRSIALAALAVATLAESSSAGTIFATGYNQTPGAGVQDAHWAIVAAPTFTTPSPAINATPYAPYVSGAVPNVWLGGSANAGDGSGAHWVTLRDNSSASAYPFGSWEAYSFVLAQTFTIEVSDTYTFNFYGSGDDYMSFNVDGTVSYVAPTAVNPGDQEWFDARVGNFATVVGGTQISSSKPGGTVGAIDWPFGSSPAYTLPPGTSGNGDFGSLTLFTGTVYLTAGTHTAYAIVHDGGGDAGAIVGTSTFNAVPEPSTFLLFSAGAVLMLGLRRARKLRAE